ncbi:MULTISPECIES: hypothetical protein [Bradyrhizobium]|jgi:hypothetical protein|uniref:Uncharacterized protein n=1 Tax=Bradyrhizobium diversitatis TaxID=2755406 RepID=A0ABS0NZM1_9BRAD|nr:MULTISPECIES: hypothetical protein [Bradyrhizobium]KYK49271.1 hypothetical protein A1D31_26140 [Bradyrhizobium liaoningense]MBH5386457.1 hypothetical protein [Bradyrhizobium diversitatis]QOZ10284.1 hypothetical protein XH96_24180 [Bradyrhizobium sp. CCBAU 51765]UPJ66728.1 hypothetical protein IVB23_04960 [Bradyrhizobium sp. 191]WLB86042.1 hypothetical protein QIH91_24210 [Bradyrhizobium japonicum USDA 135]
MSTVSDERTTEAVGTTGEIAGGDPRLAKLVDRLPGRMGDTFTYLLKPSSRWVRIPSGTLLVAGGVLSFLPLLGVWMLPLGLALLAEDVPALRSSRSKVFDWIERRKPHWLDPSTSKNDQT